MGDLHNGQTNIDKNSVTEMSFHFNLSLDYLFQ